MVSKTATVRSGKGTKVDSATSKFVLTNTDSDGAQVMDSVHEILASNGLVRKSKDSSGVTHEREITKQSLYEDYIRRDLGLGKELSAVIDGFHKAVQHYKATYDVVPTTEQAKELEAISDSAIRQKRFDEMVALNTEERNKKLSTLVKALPDDYFGWH